MFAMPYGSGDAAIAPKDGRLASRGSPVKGRPPHAKRRRFGIGLFSPSPWSRAPAPFSDPSCRLTQP